MVQSSGNVNYVLKNKIETILELHMKAPRMTSAILNIGESIEVVHKLRDLAKLSGVFVLAVLDCDHTIENSNA